MDRRQRLFVWLAAVFVTALIVGDIIGGKVFRVAGFDLSVGMIPFPLTFVLTDIVNEFYGPEGARRITYLGLGMAVFAIVILNVAIALPSSPETYIPQPIFANVLGNSIRLYVASLTAYIIGQLLDIASFQFLRRLTGHRFLGLRATGSTLISQLVDTTVVTLVFWWGHKPFDFILTLIRNSYAVKILIAIGLTPLVYLGHALVRRSLDTPVVAAEEAGHPVPP